MDGIVATSKELESLATMLRKVSTEMEKATGVESKNSAEAKKMVATYNELTKTASNLEGAIKNQFKQMQSTQQMLQKLGKTEEEVVDIQKNMVKVLLGEIPASKQVAQAFKEQARTLNELKKQEEKAIATGKALERQTKSFAGKFEDTTKKLSNVVGWKTALGGALGLSFGIKELGSTLSKYNRDLFESTRIAKTYGESLGSMKRGIEEASQKTTLSKQAFVEINKTFKEMYVGIPLTTSAVANLASKLQNNLGYSAEMTTKAMQDLLSLQSRMPDVVDRVSDAIDAYASGSGSAIQKTMALRGHLRDLGLSTQEVRKQMLMVKPPDLKTKGLLGYEKTEADRAKAAADAQLSVAKKLENQMKLLNKSMTAMLKLFQIIPASVIQLGAALVGVAAVAPGLARVGTTISTMRIEAMAATKAFMMLRGAASGIGGGAMMGRGVTVGAGSPLLTGATRIPLSAARTAGAATVGGGIGANAVTTTTGTGRMARMGAGVGSAASMGGMIAGIAQISGLLSVASGGTEAARANEEEWGEASAGRKIGMAFTGKGLAAGASRFGRGAGTMYEKGIGAITRQEMGDVKEAFAKQGIWGGLKQSGKAFGGYLTGGASLTGKYADKADKEDEMLTKGTVGKKKFMEGILLKRNAMPGESAEDLKKQNDLRQKAATFYTERLAVMKETKEYQAALASKDVAKTIQMEKDLREKVEKVVEKTIPGIKNVVKIQEDNNKKLNDEFNTRSRIQDQITRTISMIKLSQERLGDVRGAAESMIGLAKQGLITPEGIKTIKELAQTSMADLALAQKESNAMILDVATRIGGKPGEIFDQIMEGKSQEEQTKYKQYKGIVSEILGLEKQIKIAEEDTSGNSKKTIEDLKSKLKIKEKLAEKERPQIQVDDVRKKDMLAMNTAELKSIQNVMNKQKDKIKLTKDEEVIAATILTKSLDTTAMLKEQAQATEKVESKKKIAADTTMAATTVDMEMKRNLTGLEEERAAAESRRAKAYNLGVHAGYTALNQQIVAAKKYIAATEDEISQAKIKQKIEMETAGLTEGKDYSAEDSPEAIGLKLQAKAAQLRKDNRVEEAEQVDGIYSKAVNYQTTIFKLGTTLANKQAEVAELTKEVMEGYLAANKEFIANAGVFSGIIGTTKKGVTQFFAAGAAHAKALGATVPRSEGGAGSVGGPAPRYESGKGTVSIKGPNPLEAWIAKMGFQPKSGAQIYQQLPEEYLGSAKEEAAKRGISVTEYLDIVNKKSKNKVSSGAGPRTPTPPAKKENRISPYTPEEVSQGLPMGASGGATPSGYVISTPKVDQYKDLVSMLNPSMVQGGVPGKDSVPVAGIGMLMPGEAIVTGDEESAIAEMINEGQIKGMARGGSMGGMGAFGKSYAVGSKNAERNMGGASFGGEGSYAVGSKNAERNMGGARLGTMGARAGSDEWKGNLGMGPIAGSDEWKKNLSKQREESSRLFATKRVEEIEQRVAEKRKRKEDADRLERYNLVHRGSELEQKTNKQIVERNIISGGEGITREQQAKVMAPAGIGGTERQIRIAVAMARKAARVGDWEAASGGYFGGNNGIQVRHMASGGSIQVPRGLAKQFASSGATTTNVFDLSNAAKEFFKATPDIANHRSGTRV